MRLLLKAGKVREAKELDLRFFGRGLVVEEEEGGEGEVDGNEIKKKESLRFGLGLDRGGIRIAWMQSIAVRLEEGEVMEGERAKEFGELLEEMREKERGELLNPLMLAFVVRKLEVIHERLEGGGKEKKGARRQIRGILKEIKRAELGGEEIVSLALLDGAVEKLERQVRGQEHEQDAVDAELFGEVERKIQVLVGTLEPNQVEEDLQVLTELHQRIPDSKSIERHSHILYLAIRFLLLRARQQTSSSASSSSQFVNSRKDTLSSASQLYTLMLDLTPSVSHSTLDLVQLRQRQSSALYRLLWAHLGIHDTPSSSQPHSQSHERLSHPSSLPAQDHELISSAYDLIDLTLSSLSSLPPLFPSPTPSPVPQYLPSHLSHDPLLLGVTTKFHRQD